MPSEGAGPAEKRSGSHRCSSSTRFTYGNGPPVHENPTGRHPCPARGPAGRALTIRRACAGGPSGVPGACRLPPGALATGLPGDLLARAVGCAVRLARGPSGVRPRAAGRLVRGPSGDLFTFRPACADRAPDVLPRSAPRTTAVCRAPWPPSVGRPAHGPSGAHWPRAGPGVLPRSARRPAPVRPASRHSLPGASAAVCPGVSAACCVRASPTARTPRSGPPSPR